MWSWHFQVMQCQATVLLINCDLILKVVNNVTVVCGGTQGVRVKHCQSVLQRFKFSV